MSDFKRYLFISIPFLLAYIYYVGRTPAQYYNNSAPYWEVGRILIVLSFLMIIYLWRWRPRTNQAWNPFHFLTGFVFGGFLLIFSGNPEQYFVHPLLGMATCSGMLSGLFVSPFKKWLHAVFAAMGFLILQGLVHLAFFIWWEFVI